MNLFPNFDNLGWAMLILMVATSLNGYTPYMVQAMSAPNHTGEGGLWRKNGNFTLPCVDQTMPVLQKGRREGGREGGREGRGGGVKDATSASPLIHFDPTHHLASAPPQTCA